MSLATTRAVLLRAHPFSESSRVLRFLTEDRGIVGLMARGVRRTGSRGAAGLDTFAEGLLTFYHKDTRDLQTFKEFDVTRPRRGLGRDPLRLASASVLGEIVLRHADEATGPELFRGVARALDAVEAAAGPELVPLLLREGWSLVARLGYHPEVDRCVACHRELGADEMGRFDYGQGGVRCGDCGSAGAGPRVGPGGRAQLAAFLAGGIPPDLERPRAHLQLLSDFIGYHLAPNRPLDAFRVLAAFVPADDEGQGGTEEKGTDA